MEHPKYKIWRELQTKIVFIIYDESYYIKVNKLIEMLGIKKIQRNKGHLRLGIPLLGLSKKDVNEVQTFLSKLDLDNELEPRSYVRNKRIESLGL